MTQPDRIHLRDHILSTEIGAFQSERGQDQRLRFGITVDMVAPFDAAEDHVDRILSYDVLTQAVEVALADQRYNLVETLAENIAAQILTHPQAGSVTVSVEKLDRGPGALGVTIMRSGRPRMTADATLPPVSLLVGEPPAAPRPDTALVILPGAPGLPLPQSGDGRRIALLALDQAAWSLGGRWGIEVSETRTELDHAIHMGQPVIWAPYRLTADAPEAGQDGPSLAFWLARKVKASSIAFALPDDVALPDAPVGTTARIVRAGPS